MNKTSFYQNKNVLITGGLGFIGSNIAINLVKQGAHVTIIDSMIPEYGGNLFNIKPVEKKVAINFCDITDRNAVNWVVRKQDYIFHLAGQVSHIMSLSDPYKDIDYNLTGTLVLLEACRYFNPKAKIIYTGTRGQYGRVTSLPVKEDAPTNPTGIYEITNLAAEKILQIYQSHHKIFSILTRITNVYGPRSQMKSNKYGVVNWLIRQNLDNQPITIFGDGLIKRDFIYIDDVVEILLLLPTFKQAYGEIFNIGHSHVSNFSELAHIIVKERGKGKIIHTPFSAERAMQEPGDFYSDISKIYQFTGWKPTTPLNKGVRKTIKYYEKYKEHYWQ